MSDEYRNYGNDSVRFINHVWLWEVIVMIESMNTFIAIMIPFVIVLWLGWVSLQVCDLIEELDKVKSTLIVVVNQLNEHAKQLDELRGRFDDDGR